MLDADIRKWLREILDKHIQLERYSDIHVVDNLNVTFHFKFFTKERHHY